MRSRRLPLALILLVVISIHLIPTVESAVASIDLGSEWIKVAVVNLKPGQSPISVAINEMSKRKSPALVAFSGGNRLVGEEAAGIAARYPDKVYSLVRDMIGKPYKHVKEMVGSLYLPFDLVEDSRGAVGIRTDDGGTVYSAEELLAMVLKYGMGLAESHARVPVKDAVISVPPYFGQAERKGVMQSAQLAGINVLGLINEHAGAALQYGIDKDFSNESRHVIFYDMGAGSTYAALVHFSAYKAKEFGKTVSVNQFQVKDVRWIPDLGGQQMELRLVEYFADEFNKQLGNGLDIRTSPKAMAKLKKQVKRTKEILSANTAAPISVESLYDDRDFRSSITREKFEELCGEHWDRALDPVKEVIKNSGLSISDIYAVELIGGGTRVPKLQTKLQEFLGKKDLDKHLDADEAIVLGSALHAANLSDGIKLNRKLGIIDGSPYGFTIALDGADMTDDEKKEELLVQRMRKVPIKFFRTIKHNKDFDISLNYDKAGSLPPGVLSNNFAQFGISGLTEANEKYSSRNLSSPIKATLHFSLSRSGIILLERAEAVVEYFEWVEVPKKNITAENSTLTTPETSAVRGNNTEENKEKLGAVNNITDSSVAEDSTDVSVEKKLKKKTFRVPLKIVHKSVGPGSVLSKEAISEAKLRLDALDKKDSDRRRTAELKNSLEEYIYATRGKLEDSLEIEKVSTEAERKSFMEKLEEAQEWLYTDGEDASANEFQERLTSLKAIGDPIFFRSTELSARPDASRHARTYLSEVPKIVDDWEKNKSWLPRARIDEVIAEAEKFKKWLEEKEALQEKTSDFSTPVYTSEEVYQKILDVQHKVASVSRISKPKPKVEKPTEEPKVEAEESTPNSEGVSLDDEQADKPSKTDGASPDEEQADNSTLKGEDDSPDKGQAEEKKSQVEPELEPRDEL